MAGIGVIGAGSWGIALSVLLHNNGNEVTVWSIIKEEITMLETEREHKDKLPGVKLPQEMRFTTDLKEAVEGKDLLVLAVPSPFTRSTSKMLREGYSWASLVAQLVKNLPAMWETWVLSLGWEDPLEKGKATHSRISAWRMPWTV